MKVFRSIMTVAFAITLTAGIMNAQKSVDVANSSVVWKAYKVTGSHTGTIAIKEGTLTMTDGTLTGGKIIIDMTSIAVTDLEGKMKGKLEGHLKSNDFFGVETFGTASLNITKVINRGPAGDYKVIGDLTIKNITKELKFNVALKEDKMVADLTIDRSEFDVRYGSGSFFDNLGDKTIYDEFELTATVAVK